VADNVLFSINSGKIVGLLEMTREYSNLFTVLVNLNSRHVDFVWLFENIVKLFIFLNRDKKCRCLS
jgi:hypothetical protein